jgi:hypothetical protein
MRLKFHDPVSSCHTVHDAERQAEPEERIVGMFTPGHTAKVKADDPTQLEIHDATGKHIATFHGPHVAAIDDDGQLFISKRASAVRDTTDAGTPGAIVLGQPTLSEINRRHAEFYRPRPCRTTQVRP